MWHTGCRVRAVNVPNCNIASETVPAYSAVRPCHLSQANEPKIHRTFTQQSINDLGGHYNAVDASSRPQPQLPNHLLTTSSVPPHSSSLQHLFIGPVKVREIRISLVSTSGCLGFALFLIRRRLHKDTRLVSLMSVSAGSAYLMKEGTHSCMRRNACRVDSWMICPVSKVSRYSARLLSGLTAYMTYPQSQRAF
jgi:hypothetical protein